MSKKKTAKAAPACHCAFDRWAKTADLVPHRRNPNKHPAEQLRLFVKIITATGWRRPIVVSKLSGHVVKGNGALGAALLAGWDKVPVNDQPYDSPEQEHQDLIADNELARLAENDPGELKKLLAERTPALSVPHIQPDAS